MENFDIARKKV